MVNGLKEDPRTVVVTDARRALLDYVIVLTEKPWLVKETHVRAMREHGYCDEAICVANFVTGFFAWCNRAIDGLGVPLEEAEIGETPTDKPNKP